MNRDEYETWLLLSNLFLSVVALLAVGFLGTLAAEWWLAFR
jgi:hypothetical protein